MVIVEDKDLDQEIIQKAMNNDPDAFTEIYKKYNKLVYVVAFQYYKKIDVAEDIVQEVFIKVYNKIGRLETPKAFTSWLHVITYRTCQNHNRRKLKVYELNEDEQIENFLDPNSVNVIQKINKEIFMEVLNQSLNSMTEPMKEVATLRYIDELKIKEIANLLNVPNSTVSSRLIKIKKKLRDDLKDQIYLLE